MPKLFTAKQALNRPFDFAQGRLPLISDCRFQIVDCGFRIAGFGSAIVMVSDSPRPNAKSLSLFARGFLGEKTEAFPVGLRNYFGGSCCWPWFGEVDVEPDAS